MKPTTAIALTAAKQVACMAASAIVLVAVAESFQWMLMWNEARKG